MVTHVHRGGITEFIHLAAEAFGTEPVTAEAATRDMLVRLHQTPHDAGAQCLLDNVPGSRDLVFAELLRSATDASPLGVDASLGRELFALFIAYSSAHGGVECADRLLETTRHRMLHG